MDSTANAAAKLGHDLKAAHVPLAVGYRGNNASDAAAERLVRLVDQPCVQASAAGAAPLVGLVVALVPEPAPAGFPALAATIRAAALLGAVRRACWTVQILRSTPHEDGRGESVSHFDDLGVYGLLFDHARSEEFLDFARRRIGGRVEYDRKHPSELVETLRQIFRRRSLAEASAALRVHV